jgi:hypothetical protein
MGREDRGRHQYLTAVELLLPLALLRSVSAEDDVDFSVNTGECEREMCLWAISKYFGD